MTVFLMFAACLLLLGLGLALSFRFRRGKPDAWPHGDFLFDVAGEAPFQDRLKALQRLQIGRGGEALAATLVPRRNVFAIDIDGETVGHLGRFDSLKFRRRLLRAGLAGRATRCRAMIVGGGRHEDGSVRPYGIRLDIEPPTWLGA
jgi:hypothetical protein